MTLNRNVLVGLGLTSLLVVAGTVWAANAGGVEEVAEQPGFAETVTTETAAVAADAGVATTAAVETTTTDTTVVPASLTTDTVSTEPAATTTSTPTTVTE